MKLPFTPYHKFSIDVAEAMLAFQYAVEEYIVDIEFPTVEDFFAAYEHEIFQLRKEELDDAHRMEVDYLRREVEELEEEVDHLKIEARDMEREIAILKEKVNV